METNTIFHVRPGARALTYGMYGCDLRCPYCHNHALSQALRDGAEDEHPTPMSAQELVDEALAADCKVVCAAYNEPMISAEWNRLIFAAAKAHGLVTALITDGHSTPEAIEYMRGVTDVLRVDLKAQNESAYRRLGGRLQPVLDTIALGRQLGYWVEVATLVVPGLNDDQRSLASMGQRLRDIDPAIPWHLNAFVPRYRMSAAPRLDPVNLIIAAGAAYVAGSRFVYVGNTVEGAELAHTRCPECRTVLVKRRDYAALERQVRSDGGCSECGSILPGLWGSP